jgi:uncharacterized protein involved in exopolysaccharide biosynthesis
MPRDNLQDTYDDEIDVRELFSTLWLSKKFILILTGIFAVLSVIFSLSLTNLYTSQALLIPTSLNSNNTSQYSALASVAGVKLDDSSPDVTLAIAFINSKKIIRQLIKHESFLPDLMAAKKWHIKSNSIIYDDDLYDKKNKKWVREVDFPFQQVPSEQEAFALFSKQINISEDKKNQLVTLSVEHISPSVAQQWAEWIIDEANTMVANLRIEEAESSINYLNEQIKLTPYAELRTMFFNLIQQNTQNMMLAKVSKQYALTIIDPPLIPEIKSNPQRALICILGTLLGGMLSLLIILVRKYGFSKDDELDIFRLR